MASVTTKLSFVILMVVMVLVGGLLTLLRILWAIVTRPLTVFKKVHRNGKYQGCRKCVAINFINYSVCSRLPILIKSMGQSLCALKPQGVACNKHAVLTPVTRINN